MKRSGPRTDEIPPTDLGFARWAGDLVDRFEDYASESLIDHDDEREAVGVVLGEQAAPQVL